jgi:hypothetical protein
MPDDPGVPETPPEVPPAPPAPPAPDPDPVVTRSELRRTVAQAVKNVNRAIKRGRPEVVPPAPPAPAPPALKRDGGFLGPIVDAVRKKK